MAGLYISKDLDFFWDPEETPISAAMYAQRPTSPEPLPIRKISPRSIASNLQTPPCTQENWQHLVNIVMRLVQDKHVKDSVVSDLATRMSNMETTLDNSIPYYQRK
jgi:hypothetical protein